MTLVRFLRSDGSLDREVEAPAGTNLLALGQASDQPLEGVCEGAMACSTCHVILVAAEFDLLPRPSEEEDDLLDLAANVTASSRLACQIDLPAGLVSLTVRMPGAAHNWQDR